MSSCRFSILASQRIFLDSESSGVARVDFLASIICVVTRLRVDAACAMSWVWFSGRGHTKREGNITDKIATTWDGLCWRSADYARYALAKLSFFS